MSNKITRPSGELSVKLGQQIELLRLACTNFDNGTEIAGLNIGTTIRVLVHDTHKSHALLNQLGLHTIEFYDTALDKRPKSVYLGLVIKYIGTLKDGVGGPVLYIPVYKSEFHFRNKKWTSFYSWWNQVVFENPDGTSLTRRQLVLGLANQEGGAHIDPEIDKAFDVFRHSYSGGMRITGSISGIERPFDNIPVLPSIRQVGYEIIESFKKAGIS